jgi:hypothetical protein
MVWVDAGHTGAINRAPTIPACLLCSDRIPCPIPAQNIAPLQNPHVYYVPTATATTSGQCSAIIRSILFIIIPFFYFSKTRPRRGAIYRALFFTHTVRQTQKTSLWGAGGFAAMVWVDVGHMGAINRAPTIPACLLCSDRIPCPIPAQNIAPLQNPHVYYFPTASAPRDPPPPKISHPFGRDKSRPYNTRLFIVFQTQTPAPQKELPRRHRNICVDILRNHSKTFAYIRAFPVSGNGAMWTSPPRPPRVIRPWQNVLIHFCVRP